MRLSVYLLLFYLIHGILTLSAVYAAERVDDIERLRANVIALSRIQKNILQDIASRTGTGTISQQERTELQVFASFLQDRNREYCTRLIELSSPNAVTNLPCPAQKAQLPVTKTRTVAEEMSELDRMLAESLGNFDEMLLREQEQVAAKQPRERESGGEGGAAGVRESGISENLSQAGKSRAVVSRGSGQQGAGTGKDHGRPTVAAGKPGSASRQTGNINRLGTDSLHTDDDIVARQLREAAEKETNPELKEKLWDEYRKYKTGR